MYYFSLIVFHLKNKMSTQKNEITLIKVTTSLQ